MSTTIEKRGKWSTLGVKLERLVKENLSKPKGERKTLSKLFDEFAENNDTTPQQTSKYYYNEIRPNLEMVKINEVDKNIEEYSHKHIDDNNLRFPKDFYKVGDVIDVEVSNITSFGIFVKTKELFEGLIHISEITGKQYVDSPEDFFYVGEKVKAKILRINSDNKIGFSTKAVGGKDKINPVFKDLAEKVVEVNEKDLAISEPLNQVQPERKAILRIQEEPVNPYQNDKDNLIQFLKKYSDNNVSKKALADIQDMFDDFGVFQTTMSLLEVVRDLDISSFITEKTKEKLEGDFLR